MIAPGETLQDWLDEIYMPTRVAAKMLQMPVPTLQGILAGTMPIDTELAEQLAAGTGITAQLWLNLEKRYRDGLAAGKKRI